MTNFTDLSGGGDDRTVRPYIWQLPQPSAHDIRDMGVNDMLEMAESLAVFRACVRAMLTLYRAWKSGYAQETDGFEKIHRAYDGIFVRRQFADAWRLYLTANRDYHEVRRVNMTNLRQPPYRRAA